MEDSILKSTKMMLGIDPAYTVFDHEVITNINSAMSSLNQIGVGDATPIEDDTAVWSDLEWPVVQLNLAKTLVFLRVKLAFDPPGTSYLIDAIKEQIKEQEWRLSTFVEGNRVLPNSEEEVEPV